MSSYPTLVKMSLNTYFSLGNKTMHTFFDIRKRNISNEIVFYKQTILCVKLLAQTAACLTAMYDVQGLNPGQGLDFS